MEEFGILVPFLQPLHTRLLFPEYFLLSLSSFQLGFKVPFLFLQIWVPPNFHPFLLGSSQFQDYPFLALKYVAKFILVSGMDFGLQHFKFLLKVVHPCSP